MVTIASWVGEASQYILLDLTNLALGCFENFHVRLCFLAFWTKETRTTTTTTTTSGLLLTMSNGFLFIKGLPKKSCFFFKLTSPRTPEILAKSHEAPRFLCLPHGCANNATSNDQRRAPGWSNDLSRCCGCRGCGIVMDCLDTQAISEKNNCHEASKNLI